MVNVNTVINDVKGLANAGRGVDQDGVYGTQCVDLVTYITVKYFGKMLWGNAIDLLTSAKQAGFQVIYDAPGVNPKAGDIFVIDSLRAGWGHPYGHTGIVIADSDGHTIKTIEQNVDGNANALSVGGPARYVTRNFNGVVGWFRPPYQHTTQARAAVAKPETSGIKWSAETGSFTMHHDIKARTKAPSTSSPLAYIFPKGSVVQYDAYALVNGYCWIRQKRGDGSYWYIPTGEANTAKRTGPAWGTFK